MTTPESLVSEILHVVLGGEAMDLASMPSRHLDSFSLLSIYIELIESRLVREDMVEREFAMGRVTSTDELSLLVKSAWLGTQALQPQPDADAASRAGTRLTSRNRRPPRANPPSQTDEGRERN
jgi:pantothenate kinase